MVTLIWGACAHAQTVTLNSLLQEMADRDALARFPAPVFKQGQGSTYNRASTARDQPDQTFSGWFADGDGGYYIRTENTNAGGATEYVVMEHDGPGAITKLWTPFFYQDFNNRTGPNIKIYLNGSNTPVINENLIELVTRLEWSTAEYGAKPSPRNSFTLPVPDRQLHGSGGRLLPAHPLFRKLQGHDFLGRPSTTSSATAPTRPERSSRISRWPR